MASKLTSLADGTTKGSDSSLRLVVDVNALRRYDPAETQLFIARPMNYIAAFQDAAAEVSAREREGRGLCGAHNY